jgi:hypothetical protein
MNIRGGDMLRRILVLLLVVAVAFTPSSVSAQLAVYDPVNYVQAVTRYQQMLQQYQFWLRQARRLPVDMATRYRVPQVLWRTHAMAEAFPYAAPILTALNYGDASGAQYLSAAHRLEPLEGILTRLPAGFSRRIGDNYATIEMADSAASMGIHQAGLIRFNGRSVLRAIDAMELDLVATQDDFHSQTALLNKINGANVLGLRIAERNSQFLLATLEQLLVENKRKRDAEAQVMNAHIHQWRYGREYATDLFRNTAQSLDGWRQP